MLDLGGVQMVLRRMLLILVATACWLLTVTPALAQDDERILSFHSDITIHEDSSMTVTETITVRARGVEIRRGIYRDFPMRYWDRSRRLHTVGFRVTEVLRDGSPEPYHFETMLNGRRVYIGQEDYFLEWGEYTYTLTYKTNMQLGFFRSFDELYWNVTGNGWAFPIDQASATVTLPADPAAVPLVLEAYTGYEGEQQQFYTAESAGSEARFATTRPLGAEQGLTIVVRFPKGMVMQPVGLARLRFWAANQPAAVVGLVGVVVVLLFYMIAWLLAGVDPRRGVVSPRDEVPGGLSPAVLRYVRRMGCDYTAFTSALMEMAAKGLVRIEVDAAGSNTVVHTGRTDVELTPEEAALATRLFRDGQEVLIDQDNHATLSGAFAAMSGSLAQQCRRVYFFRNGGIIGIGLTLSIVALIIAGVLAGDKFVFFFCSAFVGALTYFAVLLGVGSVSGLGAGASPSAVGQRIGAGIGALVLFVMALVPAVILALFSSAGTALVPLLLAAVNAVFTWLMPRYTPRGRELLDQIDGYRLALAGKATRLPGSAGEGPAGAFAFLPYAIALDVHRQWARQLERLFASSARPPMPDWYRNPYDDNFRHESFTSSMASSFTSSIASSSVAPGSSSGGGGGGSSGGGGGGGGGGGW